MQLYLGGHLSWYSPRKQTRLQLALPQPTPLLEILAQLQLPPAEIALAAVNGRLVKLDEVLVADADEVELHPPVGGG